MYVPDTHVLLLKRLWWVRGGTTQHHKGQTLVISLNITSIINIDNKNNIANINILIIIRFYNIN